MGLLNRRGRGWILRPSQSIQEDSSVLSKGSDLMEGTSLVPPPKGESPSGASPNTSETLNRGLSEGKVTPTGGEVSSLLSEAERIISEMMRDPHQTLSEEELLEAEQYCYALGLERRGRDREVMVALGLEAFLSSVTAEPSRERVPP